MSDKIWIDDPIFKVDTSDPDPTIGSQKVSWRYKEEPMKSSNESINYIIKHNYLTATERDEFGRSIGEAFNEDRFFYRYPNESDLIEISPHSEKDDIQPHEQID